MSISSIPDTIEHFPDIRQTYSLASVLGIIPKIRLVADSSQTTGLKWATASSGGMTLISTTTLSGNSSVTLGSISQSYKNLYLVFRDYEWSTSTGGRLYIQLNADTTANRHRQITTLGYATSTQTSAYQGTYWRNQWEDMGYNPHQNAAYVTIHDYTNSGTNKIADICYAYYANDGQEPVENTRGQFIATETITSIKIGCTANTFSAGTVLLYGVN